MCFSLKVFFGRNLVGQYQKVATFKQKRISVNLAKKYSSPHWWFVALSDWSYIARQVHVRKQEQIKNNWIMKSMIQT